jgi:hypothetical protein
LGDDVRMYGISGTITSTESNGHVVSVNGRIVIQPCDKRCKFPLAASGTQRVLNGGEAASLGHPALRIDIGMACRIVSDNDDGEARLAASFRFE